MKYFGWRPDLPDVRDKFHVPAVTLLPASVDLRPLCPPVYDQGNLGSCTANAVAAHLDFNRKKQGEAEITPSRLFIYYNERKDQGTVRSDAGSTIRESVKAVKNYGACPESVWPYDIAKFKERPLPADYSQAIGYEALTYLRITREIKNFQSCLAEGYPFLIGITVYESFHSADKNGQVPMPTPGERVLGGHAVAVVGYENNKFICRNSWGASWGDKGYFYLPQEYLMHTGLSTDFWTLRQVK